MKKTEPYERQVKEIMSSIDKKAFDVSAKEALVTPRNAMGEAIAYSILATALTGGNTTTVVMPTQVRTAKFKVTAKKNV